MALTEVFTPILNAAYIHDLSPFAIRFGESLGIRWYGLSYLAGFLGSYLIILSLSRRGKISLTAQQVSDFIFYAAVGAILGGRVGYCLFYDQTLLTKISTSFPYWGVLEVHRGGMASHGGMLGVLLACVLFAKKELLPKLELFDLVALTASLGIMFGRMANFVNGELVGRPSAESYAFAVKFPQDLSLFPYSEPARLGEMAPLAYALGYSGTEVERALAAHNLGFFESVANKTIDQIQAGNQVVRQTAGPLLTPRHPSQLYGAFLEGLLLFVIIIIARSYWPQVGVASSLFLVLYPIGRIVGEQFRLPDAQIGFQLFGLTRGQWLSFVMLIAGVIYAWITLFTKRRDT